MFPYYLFWLKLSCPTFLIICLAKGSMAPYLLEFLVHGEDKSSCFHDVVHGSASLASDWWHMRMIWSKTIIPAPIFVNENPNIGYTNFIVPCTIYRILSQPRWAENISLIYCWSFSYYFSCEFLCFLCHTFQLISSLWLSGWPIKLVCHRGLGVMAAHCNIGVSGYLNWCSPSDVMHGEIVGRCVCYD